MAQRRRRKKKSPISGFIAFLLAAAVICAGVYILSSNLGCAQQTLEKTLYPLKYTSQVEKAARDYKLDREFIYAVICTESKFDEDADSHAGAVGLMQVMPSSFEWLQGLRGETRDMSELKNPDVNIDYGCYLLRYFLDYYGDKRVAIAAYNAGFVVSKWLDSDGKLTDIPYPETAAYVDKVLETEKIYKKLYFS